MATTVAVSGAIVTEPTAGETVTVAMADALFGAVPAVAVTIKLPGGALTVRALEVATPFALVIAVALANEPPTDPFGVTSKVTVTPGIGMFPVVSVTVAVKVCVPPDATVGFAGES